MKFAVAAGAPLQLRRRAVGRSRAMASRVVVAAPLFLARAARACEDWCIAEASCSGSRCSDCTHCAPVLATPYDGPWDDCFDPPGDSGGSRIACIVGAALASFLLVIALIWRPKAASDGDRLLCCSGEQCARYLLLSVSSFLVVGTGSLIVFFSGPCQPPILFSTGAAFAGIAVVCGAAPFFIKQLRRLVRKILRRVRGEAEPPEGAAPAAASMKVVDVEAAAQDPSARSRGWSAGSGGDSGTDAPAPNSPALEATAGSSSAEGSPRLGPSALPRDGSRKLFTQALEDSYRSSVAAKRSEGSSPERMV